jgi:mannitol/fructose-specific phosphotransferase system IIA component (Ntr-type)
MNELSSILKEEMIFTGITAKTKWSAIREIFDRMSEVIHFEDRETLVKAVVEREQLSGTSVVKGVAFPHARTPLTDRLIIALGISKTGIDFFREDREPVYLIFLMITPANVNRLYLNTLSALAEFLKIEGEIENILSKDTPHEVWEAIRDAGIKLETRMIASDIMSSIYVSARPEMSLQEAANLLAEKNISCLPVVNEGNEVIGLLTEIDLIRIALPRLKEFTGELEMDTDKTTILEKLLGDSKRKVKDVMSTRVLCISANTPLSEIAATMVSRGIRVLPVVEGGSLIGMVASADILRNIVRHVGGV